LFNKKNKKSTSQYKNYSVLIICFKPVTPNEELDKQAATIWGVSHKNDPACKVAANELYGGFYGPWKELN
jgi:hypothetical protein